MNLTKTARVNITTMPVYSFLGLCPWSDNIIVETRSFEKPTLTKDQNNNGEGKQTGIYTVMDNLEVKPMLIALIKSYVTDFN